MRAVTAVCAVHAVYAVCTYILLFEKISTKNIVPNFIKWHFMVQEIWISLNQKIMTHYRAWNPDSMEVLVVGVVVKMGLILLLYLHFLLVC